MNLAKKSSLVSFTLRKLLFSTCNLIQSFKKLTNETSFASQSGTRVHQSQNAHHTLVVYKRKPVLVKLSDRVYTFVPLIIPMNSCEQLISALSVLNADAIIFCNNAN